MPHHHFRKQRTGHILRKASSNDFSAADTVDPVSDIKDFIEFVRYESQWLACIAQGFADLTGLAGLLRCQHCGELTKDEDVDRTEQNLDVLAPLLRADGQGFDPRIRVHVRRVVLVDFGNCARIAARSR
jgi:hypothetical protein